MSWRTVSITFLGHELGNEVIGTARLFQVVPAVVNVLVWLIRIFFIGAFSIGGSLIFGVHRVEKGIIKQEAQLQRSKVRRQKSGLQKQKN